MRRAIIKYKGQAAGILTQHDDASFTFRYTDEWFNASDKSAVSLTLPKTSQVWNSAFIFPVFYNLLPEGTNKQVICFENRIDPTDHFGLLMHTAQHDSIGAITVHKL